MARQVDKFRSAVAGDKDQKIADSGGLYLFVTRKGHKSWRMKYRFGGAEKRLLLGPYPDVSLTRARKLRDDAKRLLRDNRDPAIEERKRKIEAHAAAGNTFKRVAVSWHDKQTARWSPVHIKKVEQALERDVFPVIGALPLTEIDPPTILSMLRRVEERGAIDTAKRIRQHVSAIFEFAIAEGMANSDPATTIKKALLPTPPTNPYPAVRTIDEAREMLAALDLTTASPSTKFASRLLALTAARPGMVQRATWAEIEGVDWDDPEQEPEDALWHVSAARMKLEQRDRSKPAFAHKMPLSRQAIEALRQQRRLTARSTSSSSAAAPPGRR